jgi:hypothetical protein
VGRVIAETVVRVVGEVNLGLRRDAHLGRLV